METHPPSPSIEEQLAELRTTLANLHAKMLDQHTRTYEIIGRLVDADERAQRSIDDLRAKLAALDDKTRMDASQLADAIILLADADTEENTPEPEAGATATASKSPGVLSQVLGYVHQLMSR